MDLNFWKKDNSDHAESEEVNNPEVGYENISE